MLSIIKQSATSVGWLRRLTRRIGQVTPFNTAAAIAFTMAAQVLVVLAFLLPLKVVLLVAGEGIPRFLRGIVTPENRDAAIILFAMLAVACYGGYHLCQRIAQRFITQGANRLVGRAEKLSVFHQQAQLTETGYTRYVEGLASSALILVWLGLGLWLNAPIFTALLCIVVVEYLLLAVLTNRSRDGLKTLRRIVESGPTSTAQVLGSINFLVVFLLLIIQFLNAGDPANGGPVQSEWASSPIIAILSIILMRQILQRGVSVVGVMEYMARQRLRLMPLFFPSTKYLPTTEKADAFLDTLAPDVRERWLTACLADFTDEPVELRDCRCRDASINGLIYLEIRDRRGLWFGKYFSKANALKAAHETELLSRHPDDLPLSLAYRGRSTVEGHDLLLFNGTTMEPMPKDNWSNRALELLFESWMFVPDKALIEAYLRTHSLLPERLDEKRLTLLRISIENEAERQSLADFEAAWPSIRERVETLPLVIHNPQMTVADSWVVGEQGEPICLSWANWRLEAIGCDPYILKFDTADLTSALADLTRRRALDHTVTAGDLQLVARLVLLERALFRNNPRQAVETLTALIDGWAALPRANGIEPAVAGG